MTDNNSPNISTSDDAAAKQNDNTSKLRLNFNGSLGSGSESSSSSKSGESISSGSKLATEVETPSISGPKTGKSSSGELSLKVLSKPVKKSNSSESAVSVPSLKAGSVPPLSEDNIEPPTSGSSASAPLKNKTDASSSQSRSSSSDAQAATSSEQNVSSASQPATKPAQATDIETISAHKSGENKKIGSNYSTISPTNSVTNSSSKAQGAETESHTARRLAPPLETPQAKQESQPSQAQNSSDQKVYAVKAPIAKDQVSHEIDEAEPISEEPEEVAIDEDDNVQSELSQKQDKASLQDLLILVVYLVFLSGFLAWGAKSLLTWKHDVDIQPNTSYTQLCWSQDGESLAFIRDEIKQTSKGKSVKSSLWTNERFGDRASRLQESLPEEYRLTGWFANDSLIVLNSANRPLDFEKLKLTDAKKKNGANSVENTTKEDTIQLTEADPKELCGIVQGANEAKPGLSFAEVKVEDQSIRYLNLPVENTQVVGHSKDEVFMAQYLTSDKDRGQINLFSYKPGSTEAKVLVSVPSRQKEMMHVDSVVASPNNEKLAIVISVVASLSESVSEDDDTPLGVWLFNRDSKTLAWTTIAANNARDLSVVWSKDSKWLGGVARYVDEAELFAFYGDNNCQAAKLRGVPQEGDIIPLITSSARALTFVSLNRIDCYNFDQQKNVPLLSSNNLERVPNNFAVGSSGAVAYVSTQYDAKNIYICALNNASSHKVNIPDDSAKQAWYYHQAGNLQYALDYWFKTEQK